MPVTYCGKKKETKMTDEKYSPPGLAIDLCLFTICDIEEKNPKKVPEKELKVLLLKRKDEPYKEMYSLVGCAAKYGEKTEDTLKVKIKEKADIDIENIYMEIGGVFDSPERDSRGHVVSITYMGLCNAETIKLGQNAIWVNVKDVLENFGDKMAFDHYEIVDKMHKRLQEKVWKEDIIFHTLPELFTVYQLQLSYAAINFMHNVGTDQNFRRKITDKEWIEKTDIKEENVVSRNKAFYYRKINSNY